MTNSVPLLRMCLLFCALLITGTMATLPLFSFDFKKFIKSSLFIKIMFWIPIFLVFVTSLYVGNYGRLVITVVFLLMGLRELLTVTKNLEIQKKSLLAPVVYYIFFMFALMHFFFIGVTQQTIIVGLLATLCFGSVLSDVVAFFFGNYLGKHKLPKILNDHKSWEGVAGQVLGALVGVMLVRQFVLKTSTIYIFLPIGIGSAAGDLLNSFVKRKLGIKDWGNSIPGHGGYLDRLSSLSVAFLFTNYFLLIK
jgi:CDP-diglyceride synthetase